MLINSIIIISMETQIFINVEQGISLDCLLYSPSSFAHKLLIMYHPDPAGGGNYTNKVVQTVARFFTTKGYICICPNLRGVGVSDGIQSKCKDQLVKDGIAVLEYMKSHYDISTIILAGFSFGTFVVDALSSIVDYEKIIFIAPAVSRYDIHHFDVNRTFVIHGEDDEIVYFVDIMKWAKLYKQPVIVLPSTGHFFHGKLILLKHTLTCLNL